MTTERARDRQVGGNHYKIHAIEPWDIIEEFNLNFWEGNAIKYILRDKGSRIEDLKKAIHYLEYELERLEESALDEDGAQGAIDPQGTIVVSAHESYYPL